MIQPARGPRSLAHPAASTEAAPEQEPSADEFLAHWAREYAAAPATAGPDGDPPISAEELARVARYAAPLFGHRPLGGLTFGELAALPTLLEAHGFAPEASRAACRALGSALRAALVAWPDTRH